MGFALHSIALMLLVTSNIGAISKAESQNTFLQKLADESYQRKVAPQSSDGPGRPIKVGVTAFFLDIYKLDDKSMDFNANFYFRQKWKDLRLKHNLGEFILLENGEEYIWTPDLFFIEERQGSIHRVTKENTFCKIYPDGTSFISQKIASTLHCPMDLSKYPHDVQRCRISIESYGYQRRQIELEWGNEGKYEPVGFAETGMHEFKLEGMETSIAYVELTSGNYTSLQILMTFKREFGFFATRLYVPFLILVLLTSLSFWIKAELGGLRLTFLLVILYFMVNISTSVNGLAPPTPYTKAIDVWIAFCESLVFVAFLEFIVVAIIARKESMDDLKNKGEALLSLDPEDKESKLKSPISKVLSMFDARNGGSRNSTNLRIDKIFGVVFLIIFVLFNIVYWSVYCCSS